MESQHLFPLKQTNSQHIISNSGNLMYATVCACLCRLPASEPVVCVCIFERAIERVAAAFRIFWLQRVVIFFCTFIRLQRVCVCCVVVALIAENKSSIVHYCTNNKIRISFRFISNDQIRLGSSGRRLKPCIYILFVGRWLARNKTTTATGQRRRRPTEPLHKINVPTGVLWMKKALCLRK